jgi:hypothetical protein
MQMKRKILIIILILLCIIVVSSSWFFVKNNRPNPPVQIPQTITSNFKTYRNEQWGFEFQYPNDWTIEENSFGSKYSKLNLRIFPNNGKYIYSDPVIMNITTPDFADRAYSGFDKTPGVATSKIVIAGQTVNEYEYIDENLTHIDIDLPFGQNRMLLGSIKQYELIFNEMIASFKFLK